MLRTTLAGIFGGFSLIIFGLLVAVAGYWAGLEQEKFGMLAGLVGWLFAFEVHSETKGSRFLWGYMNATKQDKLLLSVCLFSFVSVAVYFQASDTHYFIRVFGVVLGFLVAYLRFVLFARSEVKALLFRRKK